MKKKMMAILMATLMLGALVAVPVGAESNVILYEPFNADFSGTAVTQIFAVPDPTTPEGQEPTNYCLPIQIASEGEQRACLTTEVTDKESGQTIPFAEGYYKLSYRAYSEEEQCTTIELYTTGTLSSSNYPYRLFHNKLMEPKLIKGQWTDYSIVFYLPETLEKDGVAAKTSCMMVVFDNALTTKAKIYYDDLKLEKLESAFFYSNDNTYASYVPTAPGSDNGYYQGVIVQEDLLGISRGAETTALTGDAEKIRPVFIGRIAD